jgi:hypothetical protein
LIAAWFASNRNNDPGRKIAARTMKASSEIPEVAVVVKPVVESPAESRFKKYALIAVKGLLAAVAIAILLFILTVFTKSPAYLLGQRLNEPSAGERATLSVSELVSFQHFSKSILPV